MRIDKDAFELIVDESLKEKIKVNQFAVAKAVKLGCKKKFIKMMEKNSEFEKDSRVILKFFRKSEYKADVI